MAVHQLQSSAELPPSDDRTTLLGFVAQKCGPCLQQRPVWDALAETVLLVDVDAFPEIRAEYGVEALPTTVVLARGRVQVLRGVQTTRQLNEALGIPAA